LAHIEIQQRRQWFHAWPISIGNHVNRILLVPLLIFCASTSSEAAEDRRVLAVESTVFVVPAQADAPAMNLSLVDAMKIHNVPGLSLAIIDNYKIVASRAFGVLSSDSKRAVSPHTIFQAASISKPVTAVGAMAMVQAHQLNLDADVNRSLSSWKVPENEFTSKQKVTLRRLLSHTAGLSVHGFLGYAGDAGLPTLPQVLDGLSPANNQPIRVTAVPGSAESYSGGGITIEQLLMTEVSKRDFSQLMSERVLSKIGMSESRFEQPLGPALWEQAASGHTASGAVVPGKWRVHPELAAAGMWTTPTDLAKFAIEVAQARRGKSSRVMTAATAREMFTAVPNGGALGFHTQAVNPGLFEHNGANVGFRASLTMNWQTGQGAVVMTNSENGQPLNDLLVRAIAREFQWKQVFRSPPNALLVLARLRGAKPALALFDEALKTDESLGTNESMLNELGYSLLESHQATDAAAIFQRNVERFPRAGNAWDSLGEALLQAGELKGARASYAKALELNPKNEEARRIVLSLTALDGGVLQLK
jgi:CubicO group peptidase (beta-lactamase class C family)